MGKAAPRKRTCRADADLPSVTVDLFGVAYTFRVVRHRLFHEGELCSALIDFDSGEVELSINCGPRAIRRTVFHELAHAWLRRFYGDGHRACSAEELCNVVGFGLEALDRPTFDRLDQFIADATALAEAHRGQPKPGLRMVGT